MHLERIIIDGFKSFAQRTELRLRSRRTVIMGPNGSGKSNVFDAVRWALGSQSPRELRGASMQDVIFKGTDRRPPAKYAEVTLVFDNSDGYFRVDAPKVEVTRRLTRDGVSTYRINGEECRLKDIHRLFADTGLGKRGYGIVSQGRVAGILDADPVQLRLLFEGVAGISGLREREAAVRRQLEALDGDLERLQSVMKELQRSLKPLEKQAERADEYLRLKGELDRLEVGYYSAGLARWEAEHARAAAEIARLSALTTELAARESDLALQISDLRAEEQSLGEALRGARQEREALAEERARTASRVEVLQERLASLGARRTEMEARAAELKARVEEALRHHSALLERIRDTEAEIARLQAEADGFARRNAELQAEAEMLRGRESDLQETIYQAMSAHSDTASRLSRLERDLEVAERAAEVGSAERASLERRLQEHEAACAALAEAARSAAADAARLQSELADARGAQADARRRLEEARRREAELAAGIRGSRTHLAALQEMEERGAGCPRAVQAALEHARRQGMDGALGTVADLISPRDGYAVAVDVALGAACHNIVVRDDGVASDLIRHLQEARVGRATFLPLSTLRPRTLSQEEWSGTAVPLTPAVEAVECDPALAPVAASLLGRTLIARTLEDARRAARDLGYRIRIVTLEGTVLAPGGAMTGGSSGARGAQPMARKEEMRALERRIAALEADLARCQADVRAAEADLQQGTARLVDLEEALRVAHERQRAANADLARAEAERDAVRAQAERLCEASAVDRTALDALRAEVARAREELAGQEEAVAAHRQDLGSVRRALQDNADAAREAASAENAARQHLALREAELQRLHAERNAATGGDQERLENLQQELEALLAQESDARTEHAALSSRLEALDRDLTGRQSAAAEMESAWAERRERLQSLESEREEIIRRSREAEALLKDLQVQDAGWVHQAEAARRRLAEIAEESGSVEPADDLTDAEARIEQLKSRIRRLGTVNLGAREEYARIKERFDTYFREHSDLAGARDDVLAMLRELDGQMASALRDAYESVNREFGAVFAALMGGGRASIEIEDPDNILESGAVIRAQPPGKKLQILSLLSGGERSMTALSLVLAILRCKPSPIVILDEVDAALDEVNVELLARYVSGFDQTQFIVVSHRRPMMRCASEIYGASMEERGVTKLVSTRLTPEEETQGGAAT